MNLSKVLISLSYLEVRDSKILTIPQRIYKGLLENGFVKNKFQRYLRPRASGAKDLIDLIRSKINSDIDHDSVLRGYSHLNILENNVKNVFKKIVARQGNKLPFIISLAAILSAIIYLMLLKQNIESNPGERKTKSDFSIVTYNCNGLAKQSKLKRVLLKASEIVDKGGIVFLQETHVVDTSYMELIWKKKFISNCTRTNSAGVIILFGNNFEVITQSNSNDGRNIIAAIESQDLKLILVNAYFPNDHSQGRTFADEMYDRLLEIQFDHPDFSTILGGDFNTCMSKNDLLNRNRSKNEEILSDTIRRSNRVAGISDAYRILHTEDGFTWKRSTTYSRLDYVFVSEIMLSKITEARTEWSFDKSDHAAVIIKFKLLDDIVKGPGIIRVNAAVLEDPKIEKEVGIEIKEMMNQAMDIWDPHTKLEFLKTVIRSVLATKTAEVRNELRETIRDRSEAFESLEKLKIKLIKDEHVEQERKMERLASLDEALTTLQAEINNLRETLDSKTMLSSRAKWFEYGEKSNKFFMNLNKSKQKQKLISEIRNEGEVYIGQEGVSKGIT
jgi:exonuclease III